MRAHTAHKKGERHDGQAEKRNPDERHCSTRRHFCIFVSPCRQGRFLSHAFFLSAQLYLYRSLCRVGSFCAPAHRAEAGRALSDRRVGADNSLVYVPLGEVFYLLAARCHAVSVVSILSADAVCAHARAAYRHVPRQARLLPPAGSDCGSVARLRRAACARADKRSASICFHFPGGCRRVVGYESRLRRRVFRRHRLAGGLRGGGACCYDIQMPDEKRQAASVARYPDGGVAELSCAQLYWCTVA